MENHKKVVASIAEKVRLFRYRKVPFRIYHGSTNSTRIIELDPNKIIDTSALSNVISVDKAAKTAVVQPNVSMDILVQKTLQYDLVPAVVPEFPGITVGGSFSGTAAESSSFKYGYFDQTVNWMEIVLHDGTIIRASPEENSDLFYGAAGAMGTLGVTTLFEIQLISCGAYVETTYIPVKSIASALSTLEQFALDETVSYLDAILFSAYSGTVIIGRLSSTPHTHKEAEPPVVNFSRAKDPWFFLHVHDKVLHPVNTYCITCIWENTISNKGEEPIKIERIPIYDYFFRYDRGSFWMGAYGWKAIPLPFNRFGRQVLDRFFRTRTMYKAMHHSGPSQRFVIQDLAIPEENAQIFLEYVNREVQIYPLWLCPIRWDWKVALHTAKTYSGPRRAPAVEKAPHLKPEMLINVGLWGVPELSRKLYNHKNFSEFVDLNRDVEKVVRDLGGLKWLYAHNYYKEEEFWQVYDKEKYNELRGKWKAEGLPSIWDKVKKEKLEWRPVHIGRALLLTALGRDHLLRKGKK
jgi:delta24-sterol reductase